MTRFRRCDRTRVGSRCLQIAGSAVLALLAVSAMACSAPRPPSTAAPAAVPAPPAPAEVQPWTGPETDFREVDGHIVGPWWQGGGPGAVYFTGPQAQRHKTFVQVGETVAEKTGRPYVEIHKEQLLSSDADRNGILVYPDGTARVRLFLMPGGNSFFNMCDIAGISEPTGPKAAAERAKFVEARKTPQAAFKTGMNYVASCGGFFTGTSGYDVKNALFTGWGLWPGKVKAIGPGMNRPFPDVVFDPANARHPLYQATSGGVLKAMYFNGGPLGVPGNVPDTEYLGKYSGGNMPEVIGDWFLIAYRPKDNPLSGRCVMATGHPEVSHGDFLLAMALYALAHDYEVPRRTIEPGKPVEEISGDDQMQYYCLTVEARKKMTVTLTGMDENCDLYLRAALPPTFLKNDMKSANGKTADERLVVASTRSTTYFLGVHGKHAVLNGAKYTLTVTVE